jgi:sulfur relay (sulfurtransferase) DsrF/TusC family protein
MDSTTEKALMVVLKCECNGKEYKTPATYKAHKTSNIHQILVHYDLMGVFVINKQLKDFEIQTTRLQNENDHLKRLNVLLMDRIHSLQSKW